MSGKYAAGTDVSTEKSRMEIERALARYGASSFGYATKPGSAMIQFEANERRIRFIIPLPKPTEQRFTHYKRGAYCGWTQRSESAAAQLYEQACRQIWRALLLVVKAKLEAVAAGITTFEDEFLAHTVLQDGRTFGEWARSPDQLRALAATGLPPMLPGATA